MEERREDFDLSIHTHRKNTAMLKNDEWETNFLIRSEFYYIFDCVTRQNNTKIWQEMNIKEERLFLCVRVQLFCEIIHERKQRRCKCRNKKGCSDVVGLFGLTQKLYLRWIFAHEHKKKEGQWICIEEGQENNNKKRLHTKNSCQHFETTEVKELFASWT